MKNYQLSFLRENMMGPNAVKITEELTSDMVLKPGMRVLDLGCGRGLSSFYLADNFDLQVFAVDLWIDATDNYMRIKELGLQNRIFPIHADVNNLPFPKNYFDAIICVDAYHYFGCKEGFLSDTLAPLLVEGGQIAVAVPGLKHEFTAEIPDVLKAYITEDMNFHSCPWWKSLWEKEDLVKVTDCREMNCMKEAWFDWLACDNEYAVQDIHMMEADDDLYLNFVSIKAVIL